MAREGLQAWVMGVMVLTAATTGLAEQREAIFNVTKYGAVGDGTSLDTAAIQGAIDAATANGGGTVRVPAGQYLIGTIDLKSNVTLHLEGGAVLRASQDQAHLPDRWPQLRSYTDAYTRKAIIYAEKAENIAIVGKGMIHGQGVKFRGVDPHSFDGTRPFLVRLVECRNVTLRDIELRDSSFWGIHLLACTDVNIDGIRIDSTVTWNNDGIGVDSSQNVRISNCNIRSGDDGIVLKTTTPRATRNVVVTNCVISSNCNAIKIGTETVGDVQNVAVSNIVAHNGGLAVIALLAMDGGRVERNSISDVVAENVRGAAVFMRLGHRARPHWVAREGDTETAPAHEERDSVLRDITIRNVYARDSSPLGCTITDLPGNVIENVVLENVHVYSRGGGTREMANRTIADLPDAYPEFNMFGPLPAYGFYVRHVKGIRMDRVRLGHAERDVRPALAFEHVRDLELVDVRAAVDETVEHAVTLQQVDGAWIRRLRLPGEREAAVRVSDDCRAVVIE